MASIVHNQVQLERSLTIGVRFGWIAALIVVIYTVLALWWSVVVPLGEGPDEPGHIHYALFLAQTGRLPVQQGDPLKSDVPGEGHQPPLAYWLLQPAVRWLPASEFALEMGANPQFLHNGGADPNAYFRSSRDIFPYQGLARAWHLARGISVLLGALTLGLIYLTARASLPDQPGLALGATALAAFNPQFIFHHALVSNDPLLITLASGLLYVSVILASRDMPNRGRVWLAAAAGLLLGLMLITKQSALALVPLPLIALACAAWTRRIRTKMLIAQSALIVGSAALVATWWYVRNLRLYGDALGLDTFQQTFAPGGSSAITTLNWSAGLWNLLRSSWGNFGWLSLPLSVGAYWVFAAFMALAAIGLCASVGRSWWAGRGAVAVVLVSAVVLVCAWTGAFAMIAGMVAWQGRFLFPAIPALALLLACGLAAALPQRSALGALLVVLLLLALGLPYGLIAPSYPSYVLPAQVADMGNVYGRFDVGWKRGIELRDVQVARTATVGDTLTVTLTWRALEQADRPWTVFIHLVDANEQIIAERNAQPFNGAFPTNGWVRGDWIRDQQQISLQGVPPGTYRLNIGLWDEATGARLGVYDRNNELVNDRINIGPIEVKPRT